MSEYALFSISKAIAILLLKVYKNMEKRKFPVLL